MVSLMPSGVIPKALRDEYEADFNQKISSWAEQWGVELEAVPDFYYSRELFQPPEKWLTLEKAESSVTSNDLLTCYANDLKRLGLLLLNLPTDLATAESELQLLRDIADSAICGAFEVLADSAGEQGLPVVPVAISEVSVAGCKVWFCFTQAYFCELAKRDKSSMSQISVKSALSRQTLTVTVELESQPLSFEQLVQLQEGDVIPLTQNITQPLPIRTQFTEQAVASGFLVAKDNMKAMYMIGN